MLERKMILTFFTIFAIVHTSLAETRPYYSSYFPNENSNSFNSYNDSIYTDNNGFNVNVNDFNNQIKYPNGFDGNTFNGNGFDGNTFNDNGFDGNDFNENGFDGNDFNENFENAFNDENGNRNPTESKPGKVPSILQFASGDFSQTSSGTVNRNLI
jgi:hypothetical protein